MALFDEKTGGLITHWKTVAEITSLVGTGDAAKIWPHSAKQGTLPPYICFFRSDGRPFIHLLGATGGRLTTIHIYCYGTAPSEADALAELIKQATQTMRGSYSGTIVNQVQIDSIDDGFEFREQGSDRKDFWVRLVARIIHSESGGI